MEEVLVVKRDALESLLPQQQNFCTMELPAVVSFLVKEHFFAPRDQAEYDSSMKQIIPYVVIRQEGRLFLLRRLSKQTETRLHDRLSLGIGGHINPTEQVGTGSILEAGMYRELSEEVYVERIEQLQCVGVLNDSSGGVSDFHLGIVYLLDAEGEVSVRETEKMEGKWVTPEEVEESFGRLENWSQIVFEELFRAKSV